MQALGPHINAMGAVRDVHGMHVRSIIRIRFSAVWSDEGSEVKLNVIKVNAKATVAS